MTLTAGAGHRAYSRAIKITNSANFGVQALKDVVTGLLVRLCGELIQQQSGSVTEALGSHSTLLRLQQACQFLPQARRSAEKNSNKSPKWKGTRLQGFAMEMKSTSKNIGTIDHFHSVQTTKKENTTHKNEPHYWWVPWILPHFQSWTCNNTVVLQHPPARSQSPINHQSTDNKTFQKHIPFSFHRRKQNLSETSDQVVLVYQLPGNHRQEQTEKQEHTLPIPALSLTVTLRWTATQQRRVVHWARSRVHCLRCNDTQGGEGTKKNPQNRAKHQRTPKPCVSKYRNTCNRNLTANTNDK